MKWHPDMLQGESHRDIENAERRYSEKSDYLEKRDSGSQNDDGEFDSS